MSAVRKSVPLAGGVLRVLGEDRIYLPARLTLFECPEHGDRAVWSPAESEAYCYERDEVLLAGDDLFADLQRHRPYVHGAGSDAIVARSIVVAAEIEGWDQ